MPGATIDHLVSLTIFIAALVLFMSLFSQSLQTAIVYQSNRQVAIKATELLDSISLSPGNPANWGRSDVMPTSFGLQDNNTRGYVISPFSLMRLNSLSGVPVYYSKTGKWYSNVSMSSGGYLLVPLGECVNYTTATRLLGVNGSYGFQLAITPILTVSVNETRANPLQVKAGVSGPGFPLGNAYLNYTLTYAIRGAGNYPAFKTFKGSARTDASGVATLDFAIDGSQNASAIIITAHLGGLYGVGYKCINTRSEVIIPFVKSFKNGTILLAHSWDLHNFPNPKALYYNATFLVLSANLAFNPIQMNGTVTGLVNYGGGQPYKQVQIPTSDPGILVVAFRNGTESGVSLLPWGIGSLGISFAYGENPSSSSDWVATDVRQVMVAGVSYQAKIATWSLAGFPVSNPKWGP